MTVAPSEKENTIQHGHKKCGTHARVSFQTLAGGNRKIETRQRYRIRRKEKSEYVKKSRHEQKQVQTG